MRCVPKSLQLVSLFSYPDNCQHLISDQIRVTWHIFQLPSNHLATYYFSYTIYVTVPNFLSIQPLLLLLIPLSIPPLLSNSSLTPLSLVSHSSLTLLSLLSHTSLTRLSLVSLSSVTRLSLVSHSSLTPLSLVSHSSLTCLSLVSHSSVTRLSLVSHSSLTPHSLVSHSSRTQLFLPETPLHPSGHPKHHSGGPC